MGMFLTLQHTEVHGIIGSLRHTEHNLQTVFYLSFTFLTTRQQFLQTHMTWPKMNTTDISGLVVCVGFGRTHTFNSSWYLVILWTGLMRYDEMELASLCLCWISWTHTNTPIFKIWKSYHEKQSTPQYTHTHTFQYTNPHTQRHIHIHTNPQPLCKTHTHNRYIITVYICQSTLWRA